MKLSNKINELIQQDTEQSTSTDNGHAHEYDVDNQGNGSTTFTIAGEEHQHKISNFKVMSKLGHTHEILVEKIDDDLK
jgi:hypothetical protein